MRASSDGEWEDGGEGDHGGGGGVRVSGEADVGSGGSGQLVVVTQGQPDFVTSVPVNLIQNE